MRIFSIDIETYSSVDLAKCGVYRYAKSDDFEILLFAYAFDNDEVRVIDLKSKEKLPKEALNALTDPNILKTAFNANFERTCISAYFNIELPPEQWSCTEVLSLSLGLPASLEEAAKYLNLSELKLTEGKELIRYFCLPRKTSKSNNKKAGNLPENDVDKWERFKSYCKRDVEVERAIRERLKDYTISDREQRFWCLDQRINDRGVSIDSNLIKNAIAFTESYQENLKMEAIRLTGVKNPKSVSQLRKWLLQAGGIETQSLTKEKVQDLLKTSPADNIKRVLEIRQEISKTSIKKYEAMERAVGNDEKIRGLLQFYGASRTGRWAGRLVQVQNLPQNKIKDLGLARSLLKEGKYETLEMLFESPPDILSQLIRTSFIPSKGCRFIVADFSAIEARILAWLSGERWRLEVFSTHGKVYEASAARMFKVPIESIGKGDPLRQKGKIAELALGYQGGKGALITMGAHKMGLEDKDLLEIVSAWRNANPSIVRLWRDVESSAIKAVREKKAVKLHHGIEFVFDKGVLFITLPSGRNLCYLKPLIEIDETFMKPSLTYEGAKQGIKQWGRQKTYEGKLVENIIQAIARDCLCEAMTNLDKAGYSTVMHVHDEVVLDVPNGFGSIEEVQSIMAREIPWAKGLKLQAEAFEGDYYRKE
jgi:DNA polymerase bacteriophage-type